MGEHRGRAVPVAVGVVALAATLIAAGCGGGGSNAASTVTGTTTPATGTTIPSGAPNGGRRSSGSVSGPVTVVKGATFDITTSLSPTGTSNVAVGSTTAVTEQATGTLADLTTGTCVMAVGKSSKGTVKASRITITPPVNGQCGTGFAGRGGTRPGGLPPGAGSQRYRGNGSQNPSGSGSQRPPGGFGGSANFGFAFGTISAVKGSTLTVKSTRGTTTVTVPAGTQIQKTVSVGMSGITVGVCAFVNGTSGDKGVTVQAQRVSLTKPSASGCTFGFRRP